MYLTRGDRGSYPLEPGVTTVRSAFRQELEIPFSLLPDWQVALFSMYYTHSFSNAILKSPTDFHCQMGYQAPRQSPVVNHSIQLSRHQQFTHVGQVLQDLIQKLGLIVMPTLSGGTHHYGQLFMHMTPSTSQGGDQTHRPKLDYFHRDLVNGWLANHKTLPFTFLEIKTYINQATTTLMGADPRAQSQQTQYALRHLTRPSQSCIPAHDNQWADTGDNTQAWFEVVLLDRVQNPTWFPLSGIRL